MLLTKQRVRVFFILFVFFGRELLAFAFVGRAGRILLMRFALAEFSPLISSAQYVCLKYSARPLISGHVSRAGSPPTCVCVDEHLCNKLEQHILQTMSTPRQYTARHSAHSLKMSCLIFAGKITLEMYICRFIRVIQTYISPRAD